MLQRHSLIASLLVAFLCTGGTLGGTSFAQKASVPKQPDRVTIAGEKVKELLALMDIDKNGKISKQEWMKFMEAEFDRLDPEKKGEIDPKKILQSTVSVRSLRTSDLGK